MLTKIHATFKARRASFPDNWAGPDATLMAKAFWQFHPSESCKNETYCDACGAQPHHWHASHDPLERHEYWSARDGANCPYLQGALAEKPSGNSMNPLAMKLERLMHSQAHTDVILTIDGQNLQAHKAMLAQSSPVLAAACAGPFAEASANRIEVQAPTATLDALKQVLVYIYTGIYPVNENNSSSAELQPFQHVKLDIRLFGMGDYYQMTDLKDFALQHFKLTLRAAASAVGVSDVAQQVYSMEIGDEALRKAVVEYVKRNERDQKEDEKLVTVEGFASDYFSWR